MSWQNSIKAVPDWPKPGIMFRDITPLLSDPSAFSDCMQNLVDAAGHFEYDSILAIESRGFIFGSVLAHALGKRLILARKPGKLPRECHTVEYDLEYGKDRLQIHQNDISTEHRVLIFDDVLATGGTAQAACDLVQKTGATVAGALFLIELDFLKGRDIMRDCKVSSLIHY